MQRNNLYIAGLMILISRLMFLFLDNSFSQKQKEYTNLTPTVVNQEQTNQSSSTTDQSHLSAALQETTLWDLNTSSDSSVNFSDSSVNFSDSSVNFSDISSSDLPAGRQGFSDINIKTSNEDIDILENLYKKNPNKEILKTLINRLANDYQFDKSNEYIQIQKEADPKNIDANLHIMVLLNSHDISITDPESIQKVIWVIQDYKTLWSISFDDYNFYQWIVYIRYGKYTNAQKSFENIVSEKYLNFIQKFNKILSSPDNKNMPGYYQDGQISLHMMKNGYLVIAKKVALDVLTKNDQYILPYQVLAYSNFLMNNRETASQYFLKLSQFDESNQMIYKFLIWICYYQLQDYEQSVLYLSQVQDNNLQTDTYRYLLLNYLAWDDQTNQIRMWQRILWETQLSESDFYNFFYNIFYKPFQIWQPFSLYKDNSQLATMYINKCQQTFSWSSNDVCIYGQIWLYLVNQDLLPIKNQLLNLSQKYSQSYLFQILWDIYYQENSLNEAKKYYSKALAISNEINEQTIIQNKLMKFSN